MPQLHEDSDPSLDHDPIQLAASESSDKAAQQHTHPDPR